MVKIELVDTSGTETFVGDIETYSHDTTFFKYKKQNGPLFYFPVNRIHILRIKEHTT